MEIQITKTTKIVKGSNLKRFIERHWVGDKIENFDDDKKKGTEMQVPGFWFIVAEYFTHE